MEINKTKYSRGGVCKTGIKRVLFHNKKSFTVKKTLPVFLVCYKSTFFRDKQFFSLQIKILYMLREHIAAQLIFGGTHFQKKLFRRKISLHN